MTGAGDDTGEVETISLADLAKLLDRSELQPGDEAYCADELLGEVNPAALFPWSSKIQPRTADKSGRRTQQRLLVFRWQHARTFLLRCCWYNINR